MADTKTTTLAVRLAPAHKQKFIKRATLFGGTSEVLHDLVIAFTENRITITPPQPKRIYK